jgi:cell wall-associated NlpC family hydrolase
MTKVPISPMQLTNLAPLIAASDIWAEDPARRLWLANDNGRMKLATVRPDQLFADLEKLHTLTDASQDVLALRCAALTVPLVELEWPSGRHQLLLPTCWESEGAPYLCRPYDLGRFDCYCLVRDWMARERGLTMAPLTDTPERLANQMLTDGAFVTNSEIDRWERVAIPQPGDGILFALTQEDAHTPGRANHAGVYLGNARFLHHFANRLSCEAELDAFWKSRIAAFMRWKGES